MKGRPDALHEIVSERFTPRTWPSVEPGIMLGMMRHLGAMPGS